MKTVARWLDWQPAQTSQAVRGETDLQGVLEALEGCGEVALDVETTGLDPRRDRVRLLSLATDRGTWIIDCFRQDPMPVLRALAGKRVVGHNLKFDLLFLWGRLPEVRTVDTMLAAQVLEAGREQPVGLGDLAARYLGERVGKELQASDWSGELSEAQLEYARRDVEVTLRLWRVLEDRLRAEGLWGTAVVEMRALPAVAWMEREGITVDAEAWRRLGLEAEAESRRLLGQLWALTEHVPSLWGVNWDSPSQVREALRQLGIRVESTREEVLAEHSEQPVVRALLAYRHARKLASAYGEELLRYIHPQTGRIHPRWWQLVSTGRMACREPNLQQLPRDARYRRCFVAADGHVLVKADYSQIELRVAAELAGERRMLEAFGRGQDLHELTARLVLGVREPGREDRQKAKAINFGLLYGMGAMGLRDYARLAYGVELTAEEAERLRGRFFETYSGLRRWHRSQREGEVATRTLGGRRRLGVSRYTEKLNTPVQGTAADGLKVALGLLWERRGELGGAPVLAVHDEVVVEVPVERAEEPTRVLVACMRQGMERYLRRVPVEVEVSVGRSWAG